MMEYRGEKYEEDFGRAVRKLDREQADINEGQRRAYWKNRGKAIWAGYQKIIDKELKEDHYNAEEERKLYEHYEDLQEERLLKEWRSFGKTDRDWVKLKVIIFDDKGYPIILKKDEYRKHL